MFLLGGRPGRSGGSIRPAAVLLAAAAAGHGFGSVDVRPFADLWVGAITLYVSAPLLRGAVTELRGTTKRKKRGKRRTTL
jgi:hypothetical protein